MSAFGGRREGDVDDDTARRRTIRLTLSQSGPLKLPDLRAVRMLAVKTIEWVALHRIGVGGRRFAWLNAEI